jgi:hypothetical protein
MNTAEVGASESYVYAMSEEMWRVVRAMAIGYNEDPSLSDRFGQGNRSLRGEAKDPDPPPPGRGHPAE